MITFPSSTVLNSRVFKYSWALFPYIWDEIRLYAAYNCDLDFGLGSIRAVAVDEVGEKRSCAAECGASASFPKWR